MTVLLLCCMALVAAVAALLVAEWRASQPRIRVAKPAASTMFIVIAVLAGALDWERFKWWGV